MGRRLQNFGRTACHGIAMGGKAKHIGIVGAIAKGHHVLGRKMKQVADGLQGMAFGGAGVGDFQIGGRGAGDGDGWVLL